MPARASLDRWRICWIEFPVAFLNHHRLDNGEHRILFLGWEIVEYFCHILRPRSTGIWLRGDVSC